MSEKKEKFPSTFTIDNFSSTTKLASNEIKVPVGSVETLNEKDELYNPFDHRSPEHPTSTVGALVHLMKSSLGTGILAMPNAFKNGGLLFGFIGTIITGILCTNCVHVLVQASREMCRKCKVPSLGFADTAEAVFKHGPQRLRPWSTFALYFVDTALLLTYFMGGSVYVVFVSESIKNIIDEYYPELDWTIHLYILLVTIPLILTCQLRELKFLIPFSVIANISMVISFAITMYYMFSDIKEVEDRNLINGIDKVPLFFSTVIFAMEGIGVVLPVENSMKKPQQFLGCPGVLNVAMSVVVTLYSIIGFFGYMKYGEDTQASITFNLPKEPLAEAAKILIAIAVFFTYSLQFHVPMEITWKKALKDRIDPKYHNLSQIGIRSLIVAAVSGIASLVPRLEPIIALIGAIFLSTLGILIPAVIDTVLLWEGRLGIFKWKLIKNSFLITLSLFALFSGSYFAIIDIIN